MNEFAPRHGSPHPLTELIRRYYAGDDDGSELCAALETAARNAARGFPGLDSATVDDCVQDALLGILHYLQRDREFTGDLARLCVSITRNRCRDVIRRRNRHPETPIEPMTEWLADPTRSALDQIQQYQRRSLLQWGLNSLDKACRQLLYRIYVQRIPLEVIRLEEKLGSVQAIYQRRDVCLRRARKNLNLYIAGALKLADDIDPDTVQSPEGRTNDE